jgi:hypothetical protein
VRKVSRCDASVSIGIVIPLVLATHEARRRLVIVMSGSHFVRFRATSRRCWITGNNREQNDRQNPPFHRPLPFAEHHNRMILILVPERVNSIRTPQKATIRPKKSEPCIL